MCSAPHQQKGQENLCCAHNLKQKKEEVLGIKYIMNKAGIILNTYREPKPVAAVKGRWDFVYSLATG